MPASRRLVVAAVALAAGIGGVPAQVATAFTVSGTETSHPAPYPEQLLPAFFADDTVTRIPYPAVIFGMDNSIAVAVAGIANAIQATPGPMVVAGASQGAVAVARAQQVLMAQPLTAMVDAGYARHDAVAAVAATAPPRQAKQPSRERSGVTRRPAAAATGDGGPGAGGSPRSGAKRPSGQHHSRAVA